MVARLESAETEAIGSAFALSCGRGPYPRLLSAVFCKGARTIFKN